MRSKALPGWAHTLCTAAAALVFLLAYELVVYRVPVTEIFLPVSSWSDEVIYSKQLSAAVQYGAPQGYFGFNESHAAVGTYAAWGPAVFLVYALPGLLLRGQNAFLWCNLLFVVLGWTFFARAARLGWKRQLAFAAALAAMNGIGFTQALTLRKTEVTPETPALRVTMPAAARTDETITAVVTLDSGSGLAAADFCISYDTALLTCTGVKVSAGMESVDGVCIETNPHTDGGQVKFTFICAKGFADGAELVTMTFQPKKEGAVTLTPTVTTSAVGADRRPIALDMCAASCEVKDPFFEVTFRDEDGTVLSRQSVRYRAAAVPPDAVKAPRDVLSGFEAHPLHHRRRDARLPHFRG